MQTILTDAYCIWVTVSEVPSTNKGEKMNTILPELIFAAAVFAILFKTGVLIW
tara:strand:- start:756 stop:914 length:159 start_codon:yes stop_codon:yes gene_type:complete